VQTNIAGFVAAYNTLVTTIAPLASYDPATQTAGPMLGDPVLSGIQSQIRRVLNSVVNTGSAAYTTLPSVGITTNKDGTLSLNSAVLSTALSSSFGAVSQLFGGASGVAATLNTQLTNALNSTGMISARGQTLVKQENALTQQTNALDTQMAALTASLTQQYSALNTLLSSLQTQSAQLSQQLATLPQVQAKSNA
jgi:flagellar hook-associated protein 2